MISGRKIVENMEVTVGFTRIESKRTIKYLGVIIGDRSTFKERVKYIGEKASVTQGALAAGTTRRILSSEYRLIRTVFDDAVLVLAKTIPIDILADEMRRIYLRCLE